jgi:hypothetical protein
VPIAITNGQVIIIVTLIAAPLAAIAFMGVGAALRQLGKGRFAIEQDLPRKTMGAARPVSRQVREAEIRQMLEAKAYRQQARGETPLDVDVELDRLLADAPSPAVVADAELREEVRQLVVARNERRIRRGEAPQDVEAEVERQLRDLENLGQ